MTTSSSSTSRAGLTKLPDTSLFGCDVYLDLRWTNADQRESTARAYADMFRGYRENSDETLRLLGERSAETIKLLTEIDLLKYENRRLQRQRGFFARLLG